MRIDTCKFLSWKLDTLYSQDDCPLRLCSLGGGGEVIKNQVLGLR